MQWSLQGSFVISSNQLVSVIVRLVYLGIPGRSGMVRTFMYSLYLKLAVCAVICLVPYVLWHDIEEVWSMYHEASFSDCFDQIASL